MKGGENNMAQTYKNMLKSQLIKLNRLGQSRHKAKEELAKEYRDKGQNKPFEKAVEGVYSINTFRAYLKHGEHFINWCVSEKGCKTYGKSLEELRQYAPEYLQAREAEGKSLYSLKSEKSALGKIFGGEIPYKFAEKRQIKNITRSRGEAVRDTHFNPEKNQDLVTIAKATGGRREDISKLTPKSFITDHKGRLWVIFTQSKGGRDRISPVLPQYTEAVKEIIKGKSDKPNEPIFKRINTNADIHSYRREYAQTLYNTVAHDHDYRDDLMGMYPTRKEKAKGDYYYSHTKDLPFKGCRDDIYIVTQALGHNRLEVTVNHYLK